MNIRQYFYKPKKISIIVFLIFLFILVLLNTWLNISLRTMNASELNIEILDFVVSIIPILSAIVAVFCSSYINLCRIQIYKILSEQSISRSIILKRYRLLVVLSILLDTCIGVVCLYWFYSYSSNSINTDYLHSLAEYLHPLEGMVVLDNGENFVVEFYRYLWILSCLFALYIAVWSLIIIVFKIRIVSRTSKIIFRNKQVGFCYETSTFFKQTGLPFSFLHHENGSLGEFEAYRQLKFYEDSDSVFVFNREIPKKDGLTTEIDLIMLHKHGIVVIENKDYTGTFYGKASDDMWTGIGYTGISYSFYNPIKQNEGHIHALKEYLVANEVYGVEEDIPIYSVIVFTDLVSNRSDDIISRIDLSGTQSHVCTSQNLARTVWNLLENTVPNKVVDVQKVESFLLPLPIRRK